MKTKSMTLFILLNTIFYCSAQESTIVLNTSMFTEPLQTIPLSSLNGWIFKKGNDISWGQRSINSNGWKKFSPWNLSASDADKNGKLEGWFRINFILDKSFKDMQLGIRSNRWAATDIYIDGIYITSYGNTGSGKQLFKESSNLYTDFHQIILNINQKHTLAIHIVDYVAPFNPRFLKTASLYNDFNNFIELTGPLAPNKTISYMNDFTGYLYLYTGIIGAFSLLFWFLYLQSSGEKNLFHIALSTTFFFMWVYLFTLSTQPTNIDFDHSWLLFFLSVQSWPLAIAFMIYTVGEIFNFKFKRALIIFGILFVFASIVLTYFPEMEFNYSAHPIFATGLLFYITLSSWKKLIGAQWAVVFGVISTTIFSFVWAYFRDYYKELSFPYEHFYQSGMYLSFPISLMVYVSMRFKETLNEIQINAMQVVKLSEEKKEQALNQQKKLEEEVAKQTIELRTSIENLKATQTQLIQSEKMASLGELTAGIAHEIQNPLNFVNNFSEVSIELLSELKEEEEKGNKVEVIALANDLTQNLEKINHHGKRADAIVKGMLEHSRSGSGVKEPTDIDKLADEYLRLSYHGLRAKDKSFNAEMITNFDEKLPLVNVIPQDIGRVLLNLFNNAFYAVNQKQKTDSAEYQPEVVVTTFTENGQLVIKVKDNGIGIPDAIKDKIMQPFFTTKPTGEGTGLGLSLTYDMVVKGHGGTIEVNSKDGEGSEFIVLLPFNI